ncbi:MAG TPA: DNRLRE domain-containing protein, partial [Candidatus Limnocylindrales bacterium]|nr:DNRLRE domain-containing protein [Candidatus Limnocylindrales bacterium]
NQYWHNELALGGGSGNQAPVAANDAYSTPQGTPLIQNAPGVLGNDSDPDGNTLTAVLDTTVGHGTLSLNADGSFTYTPTAGYSGPDAFAYHAFDGALPSSSATVSLTVTSGSGSTTTLDPVADAQVKSTSSSSNYGTLDTLRLREDPNSGTTYRSYLRFDLRGLAGTVQSATLRLFVTDASRDTTIVRPVADTSWSETAISWSNAPAMGGSTLGSVTPSAAGGYVEIPLSPGSISAGNLVSLGLLEDGTDSAIFSSREGNNPPELVVTTASGGGGNTAPTASSKSVSTQQDTALDITVGATDPEDCELTFVAGSAAHGSVALKSNQSCVPGSPNADSAVFTYAPNAGYSGPDSFTFTASDGIATSSAATVNVTVTATGGSGSVTLAPSADAYVKSNSSKQFGTTTTMECREGSGSSTDPITRSYLTFDVSGIAGPVSAITLRLYVVDPTSNTISVHAVNDTSWTETGIVWSNAPALAAATLGSVVPSTLGDTVDIQIDPSAIASDGTYSFGLQSDATNTVAFATREDAAHAPELEITYGS